MSVSALPCLVRKPVPVSIPSRAVMAIWPGSCAELVAALLPHARAWGKSFCDYRDESKTTGNAKLIHGEGGVETKRNIELLTVLRGLQENLSFPKSIVRAACLEVAVTQEQEPVQGDLASRIENALRRVAEEEGRGRAW